MAMPALIPAVIHLSLRRQGLTHEWRNGNGSSSFIFTSGSHQSAPKARAGQPGSGMSYIYDPTSPKTVRPNANIPLHFVPAPVLMTSENKHLAGPGEPIKKEE